MNFVIKSFTLGSDRYYLSLLSLKCIWMIQFGDPPGTFEPKVFVGSTYNV